MVRRDYKHNTTIAEAANKAVGISIFHTIKETLRDRKNKAREFKSLIKNLKNKDLNADLIKQVQEYYDEALNEFEEVKQGLRKAEFEDVKAFKEKITKLMEVKVLEYLGETDKEEVTEKTYQILNFVRKIIINQKWNERRLWKGHIPRGGYVEAMFRTKRRLARGAFREARTLEDIHDKTKNILHKLQWAIQYTKQVTKKEKSISEKEFHDIADLIISYIVNLSEECEQIVSTYFDAQINEFSMLTDLKKLKGNKKYDKTLSDIEDKYHDSFREAYKILRKEKTDILNLMKKVEPMLGHEKAKKIRAKHKFKLEDLKEDAIFKLSIEELYKLGKIKFTLQPIRADDKDLKSTGFFFNSFYRKMKVVPVALLILIFFNINLNLFGAEINKFKTKVRGEVKRTGSMLISTDMSYTDKYVDTVNELHNLAKKVIAAQEANDTDKEYQLIEEMTAKLNILLDQFHYMMSLYISQGDFDVIEFFFKGFQDNFITHDLIKAFGYDPSGKFEDILDQVYQEIKAGKIIETNMNLAAGLIVEKKYDKAIEKLAVMFTTLDQLPHYDIYFANQYSQLFKIMLNSLETTKLSSIERFNLLGKLLDTCNSMNEKTKHMSIILIKSDLNKIFVNTYENELKKLMQKEKFDDIEAIINSIRDNILNKTILTNETGNSVSDLFVQAIAIPVFEQVKKDIFADLIENRKKSMKKKVKAYDQMNRLLVRLNNIFSNNGVHYLGDKLNAYRFFVVGAKMFIEDFETLLNEGNFEDAENLFLLVIQYNFVSDGVQHQVIVLIDEAQEANKITEQDDDKQKEAKAKQAGKLNHLHVTAGTTSISSS